MARRWAREIALKVLFQVDLVDAEPYTALDYLLKGFDVSDETVFFIRSLVKGTLEHLSDLDNYLEKYAIEWDLSRMANVDRNILRMGLYEMLYCQDIPLNVAINEALELSKSFSHEDAPRFINGILGNIAKEIKNNPDTNL